MHLYHRVNAGRPIRGAWVLEEAEQPYELTIMSGEEGGSEQHLARHPLGKVPALEDDSGAVVFESAAICLHVADLFPAAELIAAPGTHERALAYQWAVFAPAELEPRLITAFERAQDEPDVAAKAYARFTAAAAAVSDALGAQDFLVGGAFSVADVMVGTALAFTLKSGTDEHLPPSLNRYIARLAERPAYQRAVARTDA